MAQGRKGGRKGSRLPDLTEAEREAGEIVGAKLPAAKHGRAAGRDAVTVVQPSGEVTGHNERETIPATQVRTGFGFQSKGHSGLGALQVEAIEDRFYDCTNNRTEPVDISSALRRSALDFLSRLDGTLTVSQVLAVLEAM